jgi:hypothetical protein
MSMPLSTSPEPSGRVRLGPRGLLIRRRIVSDADRQVPSAQPAGRAPGPCAPEPTGRPLPDGLLPLPAGFDLNRPRVVSVYA